MDAFGFTEYGTPEVFQQLDRPMPEPKADQVLIETEAIGVNPYDQGLRLGTFSQERALPFPIIPGSDVAGRIVKLGANVTEFSVGDRVLNLRPLRGYSAFVTASASKVAKIPDTMSWALAVSLATPGFTAYNIVTRYLPKKSDQTTIIIGASGAVGSLTAQLAKASGRRVIGIASSKNEAFLTQLNLDETGFYDQGNVGQHFESQGDEVIHAALGGRSLALTGQLVKAGSGFIVTLGQIAPAITKAGVNVYFVHREPYYPVAPAFQTLFDLFETKGLQIKQHPGLPFTLEGVKEAHRLLDNRQNTGHLVLLRQ